MVGIKKNKGSQTEMPVASHIIVEILTSYCMIKGLFTSTKCHTCWLNFQGLTSDVMWTQPILGCSIIHGYSNRMAFNVKPFMEQCFYDPPNFSSCMIPFIIHFLCYYKLFPITFKLATNWVCFPSTLILQITVKLICNFSLKVYYIK